MSARRPAASSAVASPCISVCVIDQATGWCAGCFRSLEEIAAWGRLDEHAKRAVLARLPARRNITKGGTHGER